MNIEQQRQSVGGKIWRWGWAMVATMVAALPLAAASGDLDAPFMATVQGAGTGAARGFSKPINAVLPLPDGRALVGGNYGTYQGANAGALWLLNADGSLAQVVGPLVASDGAPEVNAIVAQPDGKVLVGGVFTSVAGVARGGLVRLNTDWTVDTAFAASGVGGTLRYVMDMAVQPDGKVVVGGGFNTMNNVFRRSLARLLPDGALDTGFVPPILESTFPGYPTGPGTVDSLVVQPDGKIVIAGAFNQIQGVGRAGQILRLEANGAIDFGFYSGVGAGAEYRLNEVALQDDGKLIVGGLNGLWNGQALPGVFRLNGDGTLDTAFVAQVGDGPNGWAGGEVKVLPGGQILVAGIFNQWQGQPVASVVRLQPDGARDLTFAPVPHTSDRGQYINHLYALELTYDGKLLAGGWANDFDSQTFGSPPLTINGTPIYNLVRFVFDFAPGPGRLQFAAPIFYATENGGSVTVRVARLGGVEGAVSATVSLPGGLPDTATAGDDYGATTATLSWAGGQGGVRTVSVPIVQDAVREDLEVARLTLSNPTGGATLGGDALLAIQDDDSPPQIIAGPFGFAVYQGSTVLLSVSAYSVLPMTFQWQRNGLNVPGATSPFLLIPNANRTDHAGQYRVVVTNANGSVTSENVELVINIPAGSRDLTFNASAALGPLNWWRPLPGGGFAYLTSVSGSVVVRLADAAGQPVASFLAPTFGGGSPAGLEVQADGRIVVFGSFTSVNGVTVHRMVRLNADGTVDTTFTSPFNSSSATASALHITSNGQFYVGFGGGGGLRRLQANGALDVSFSATVATGTAGAVVDLDVQLDGRVVVIGQSGNSGFGNLPTYFVTRLNTNGSADATFTTPSFNWTLASVQVLPDQRLLVGGRFSLVGGESRAGVVILGGDGSVDLSFSASAVFATGANVSSATYLDGQIYVLGNFAASATVPFSYLVRLNLDGTLDPTFLAGLSYNAAPTGVAWVGEQVYVGGGFTTYQGQPANYLLRLAPGPATVGWATPFVTAQETSGSAVLRVGRHGPPGVALSVAYAAVADTATSPADFTPTTGTLTWAADDLTERTVTVPLTNDATAETVRESFRIVLSDLTPPGGTEAVLTVASATVVIIDDDNPPVITRDPIGQAVAQGGTVTLTVAATSVLPLSYQWQRGEVDLDGQTSPTLTLTNLQPGAAGDYRCRVTNANGSVFSAVATISVLLGPTFAHLDWPTNLLINNTVRALAPTRDGGVYVGGDFSNFNGQTGRHGLVRLTGSGAVVAEFNPPIASGSFTRLALRGARLYAVGSFALTGLTGQRVLAAFDATTGALDTAFDTALGTGAGNATVRGLAVLPDGDVVVGGDFTSFNGNFAHKYLARLNANGTHHSPWDLSLASGTAALVVYDVLASPDGQIYVGGGTFSYQGGTKIVRLNGDGSRDTTFGLTSPSSSAVVSRLRLTPNGQVYFTASSALVSNRTFGLLDATGGYSTSTFSGTTANGMVDAARQWDGSFLTVGSFAFVRQQGGSTTGYARFDANGSYTNTYATGVGFDSNGASVIELGDDGRVWIGGAFVSYNGTPAQRLIRLNGEPVALRIVEPPLSQEADPGTTVALSVYAVGTSTLRYQWLRNGQPLTDGGRVTGVNTPTLTLTDVSVAADEGSYRVVVSSAAGSVESSAAVLGVRGAPVFVTQPPASLVGYTARSLTFAATVRALAPLSLQWRRNSTNLTNSATVAGATTNSLTLTGLTLADTGTYELVATNSLGTATSNPVAVRVLPHPSDRFPTSFTQVGTDASNRPVQSLLPLPDGGALVGGNFNFLNGANGTRSAGRFARVLPNGEVVPAAQFAGANGDVNFLQRLEDGRILVGGNFTTLLGVTRNRLAMLRADLTLDPSFDPGAGPASGALVGAALDERGRLYVAGAFASFAEQPGTAYFARLTPDGAVDPAIVSAFSNRITGFVRQTDGRLVCHGEFLNSYGRSYLVRLLPDGTADTSWTPSVSGSTSGRLFLLPDGDLLVARNNQLYRLNADGTVDSAFPTLSLPGGSIVALAPQTNGQLVLAGSFTSVGGVARTGLARVSLATGALDLVFNPTNFALNAMAVDGYGRIWIGGSGNALNGTLGTNCLAVLNGDLVELGFVEPPRPVFAEAGQTAVLSALATGTTQVFYQWRRGGQPLAEGGRYVGTTTATLTIAGLTASEVGDYDLVLTNESGTVTSAPVAVGLLAEPVITLPPEATTVDLGQTLALRVQARGAATLNYQWRYQGVDLTDGGAVAGATTPVLRISGMTLGQSGAYSVVVTNGLGMAAVAVEVTVVRRPGEPVAGLIVPTFHGGAVRALLPWDGEGRMLVGGEFGSVTYVGGSVTRRGLVLMNADGTLNPNFLNLGATSGGVFALLRDSEGRILVGGSLVKTSGSPTFSRLLRLRPVATTALLEIDPTFTPPAISGQINTLAWDNEGRLLVGGEFNTVAGQATGYICRLLPATGALDTTFVPSANNFVRTILPQSDGTVIIGGSFSTWGGGQQLIRVDANGTRLTDFTRPSGNTHQVALLTPEGLYEAFTSFPGFRRLDPVTGAASAGYSLEFAPGGAVNALLRDSRGRVYAGGGFASLSGDSTVSYLARWRANGTLDRTFSLRFGGFNGPVQSLYQDTAGRLWVGGQFSTFQGRTVAGLVILNGDDPALPTGFAGFVETYALSGADAAPGSDPDRDGVANLAEYALRTNPTVPDAPPRLPRPQLTRFDTTGGVPTAGDYLTLTFRLRRDLAGSVVRLWHGATLPGLLNPATAVEAVAIGEPTDDPTDPANYRLHTYRAPTATDPDAPTGFFRLEVAPVP